LERGFCTVAMSGVSMGSLFCLAAFAALFVAASLLL
jgi:hypothetical protein